MQENHMKDQEEDILDADKKDDSNDEGSSENLESEKLKEENKEINNKYLRMTADFQNFKKRAEKEKSDIYQFANEKLIVDLLPTIDNLERAIKSNKDEGANESFTQGIEMILQQFLDVLTKNDVKEIDAIGQKFDPNYHHAVLQEENDEYESETVVDQFQKGYTVNDKVIRPCMVKVIK